MKSIALIAFLITFPAYAGATKVGNGDDGADLEGMREITEGPIVDARAQALELVEKLNASGVEGLGDLAPEIRSSKLYLAQSDAPATLPEDQGAFHSSFRGDVYARTFPRAHAATRFFPAALALTQSQLVALHVHEALHRSLPESARENEAAVARLTLALTAPEATNDQVRSVASAVVPSPTGTLVAAVSAPEPERYTQPSTVGYSFRQYQAPKRFTTYPVKRMHVLHSHLYPFGDGNHPLGIGIEASVLSHDAESGARSEMGPLALSARLKLFSSQGFDIGVFGDVSLNTLSAEELKNSPFGRDVLTLGLSMRKEFTRLYVENDLSYSFAGTATQKIGGVSYDYGFGSVVVPVLRAGAKFSRFRAGGFAEIHLADYYAVQGGDFSFDTGRYRILALGPELSWVDASWSASLTARLLADSTKDASFDWLGNIMGQGVSQGSVTATVSLHL